MKCICQSAVFMGKHAAEADKKWTFAMPICHIPFQHSSALHFLNFIYYSTLDDTKVHNMSN